MSASSPWHALVVERIVHHTPRVASLFLGNALGSFEAGQHVDIRLVAEDGYEARRSYSIASAPGGATVELLVERLDDGEVSPFLHDVVRVGDTLDVRGPIGGHFVWTAARGGPLLLVAGGSGIAPLMSMLRHRARTALAVDALVIYGARTRDDLVFRDELVAMAAADARLTVVFGTSREAARRDGDFAGRIGRGVVARSLARWGRAAKHAYVCGSTGFVETATSALVAEGIAASAIRAERYGGIG